MRPHVVVNADDLGLSREINEGILAGLKQGIITDTSLLIKAPYAKHAVAELKNLGFEFCGIHIDLDEKLGWSSPGRERFSRMELAAFLEGGFLVEQLRKEARCQIEAFLSCGLFPTHLDTHHHVHGFLPVFEILVDLMEEYHIRAMRFNPGGYTLLTREDIPLDVNISNIIQETMKNKGIFHCSEMIEGADKVKDVVGECTELVVHPSFGGEHWRSREYAILVSPDFRSFLRGKDICLRSYSEMLKETRDPS